MKEVKIEIPEGYEIDKEKSTFEKIVFKEVRKELPKSWEELGEIEGHYTRSDSSVYPAKSVSTDRYDKNIFATKEQAEASIALAQLSQLKKVYNGDWVADWNDSHHSKWCITFDGDVIDVIISYRICRFLAFKDAKTCDLFLENFRDLIEKAKPLML